MRRLTELDLDALPAVGAIARGTTPSIVRRGGERFRHLLRRRSSATTSPRSSRRPAGGPRRMKDLFRVRRMWRPRGELKRRYDVVIIGGGSHGLATAYYLAKNHGITRRRRARAELHRLGRGRPQHDDHPLELPHARGRGVLQARASSSTRASPPTSTSTCCSRSTGHLTLAHSDRALIDDARARRGQPAARDRLRVVVLPTRSRRLCPQLDLSDDADLADHGRALPPARRDHPPRRGRLGLRARRRPRRRRDPPGHRGDRDRRVASGRVTGVRDEPRRRSRAARRRSARPPAGRRSSATSPACGCRSRRTSCRRS